MPLTLKGSSSGGVTLDVPAVAGVNTVTIPAATGTLALASSSVANQVFFGGATSGVLSQSSNFVWDNNNTRLGVGTASPSYLIHAYGSGDNAARIHAQNVGSATDSRALISFSTNASTYGAGLFLASTADSAYVASALNLFTFDNQPIVFGTGNTLKMTLDLSGNLGLGVTPSAWTTGKALEFGALGNALWGVGASNCVITSNVYYNSSAYKYANAAAASQYQQVNGTHQWYSASSGTQDATITGFSSPVMLMDVSGNLGIGTTSPSAYGKLVVNSSTSLSHLQIYGSVQNGIQFRKQNGDPGYALGRSLSSDNAQNFFLYDFDTSLTRFFVDATGNFMINTTTATASKFNVRGPATASTAPYVAAIYSDTTGDLDYAPLLISKYDATTSSANVFLRFAVNQNSNANGQINGNGASQAAFGSWSDIRLKENIAPLPSQLANILALRPSEFDYRDGSGHQIGFIAQEMQEVFPDAVALGDTGMFTVTGWGKTEARLVSAIQELSAKNDELEARLAKLEG